MQSPASGHTTSIQPTAVFAPPRHGVGLRSMQGLSPLGGIEVASLFGRESSAVWIHACHAGWSWGREEPWCLFWVTGKALHGTRLVVWPLKC